VSKAISTFLRSGLFNCNTIVLLCYKKGASGFAGKRWQ
jgi:hypothetical protein